MKKRIVALALAALMFALTFGLAGCTGSDKEDWDYIAEKGEIIIGITYFQPMNYLDASGTLVGFETEFARAVCEKLGVEPKFQQIDWKNRVNELNSKSIDCIWNGMTVLEELKGQIDFSVSYMNNTQTAVIRKADAEKYKDLQSMSGAKVVAESGSAGEQVVKANAGLAENYTAVTAQSNTFTEVKSMTADIAVVDAVTAIGTLNEESSYNDLMIVSSVALGDPEEYAIGLRKGDEVTRQKINDAITQLYADGTLERLAEQYGLSDRLIPQQ